MDPPRNLTRYSPTERTVMLTRTRADQIDITIEEIQHLHSFGITDPERICARLGISVDSYEKYMTRS